MAFVSLRQEQNLILNEASKSVKMSAFFMKKAIDHSDMDEAIRFATEMLAELRLPGLSPQHYYELYIIVTDELRYLETFFEEVHVSSSLKSNLYETVQHASLIIPRLYLLITIGSVYIRTGTNPAMDILFDLVELCKGVQHPTRGLFLRSYLTQCSKDKLPDVTSTTKLVDASVQKPVKDAIEYALENFSEVNRLWVRMQHQVGLINTIHLYAHKLHRRHLIFSVVDVIMVQHCVLYSSMDDDDDQGANRDRAKRERERQNLRMLVGANLVRLSQLESIDLLTYKDLILPRVLEQIINCKDKIAQEYLMDCLIQVFPDDYHLATLESFLSSCAQLQTSVNTKEIIISMMNRLSTYALQSPTMIPNDLEMFSMFREHSKEVIQARCDMQIADVLSLQVALVNFASKVYPDRLSYIDDVLQFSSSVLQGSAATIAPVKTVRHVVKLLTIPLETISVRVLDLSHYASVLKYLDFSNRKQVANAIVQSVLSSSSAISDPMKLSTLLGYITPLLHDLDDSPEGLVVDAQFDQEQHDLAKLIHLVAHSDIDRHFQLFSLVHQQIKLGGPSRLKYTCPTLTFALLKTASVIGDTRCDAEQMTTSRTVFNMIHRLIVSITNTSPSLAIRLFLAGALTADRSSSGEEVVYEFMTQAFVTYEEEIASSKEQFAALVLFANAVQQLGSISEDSYETLRTKVAQHAARLLKKSDQVQALCLVAHMLWTSKCAGTTKGDTVFSTLQRAIKVSNNVMDPKAQTELLVEILDHMVYFFEKEVAEISSERVKNVVELVQEHIADLEDGKATRLVKNQFSQIINRVKSRNNVVNYSQDNFQAL